MRPAAALLLAISACAHAPLESTRAQQLILVQATGSAAQLELYEDGKLTFGPVPASVGRTGVIDAEKKREGDGHTPAGLYALPFAFGYAPTIVSAMPYRESTADIIWVDDPSAPDYNRWTTRSASQAKSFEVMRRDDGQYEIGLVIAYNMEPPTPGAGSAIFLHVWKAPGAFTSGCVAVEKGTLDVLLARLDPAKEPRILIQGP